MYDTVCINYLNVTACTNVASESVHLGKPT